MTKQELENYDKKKWENIKVTPKDLKVSKEEVESLIKGLIEKNYVSYPQMNLGNLYISGSINSNFLLVWITKDCRILEVSSTENSFELVIHWFLDPSEKVLLALKNLILSYNNYCFLESEKLKNEMNETRKKMLEFVEKAIK